MSWAALFRLQATIRWSAFATLHGFHFEACALQRLMIERLAWIAAIREIEGLDYLEVAPQASLSALKDLFPNAGSVYGRLSAKAHITPDETKAYISANEEGDLSAQLFLRRWAPHDAAGLLILADMYIVLSELIVADLLSSPVAIKRSRGRWVPKSTRPFQKIVKRLGTRLVKQSQN